MALTARQARFVDEYLVDLNATQAASRAGYSAKTASSQGERLLRNVEVATAVSEAQQARSARTEITQDRVLQELARIGFADVRKAIIWRANVTGMVHGEDGEPDRLAVTNEVQVVDSDKLDDDTAAAISEVAQTDKGGLRIKLHDKRAALVAIGEHLGMFRKRVEVTGKDGRPIETHDLTDKLMSLPRDKRDAVRAAIKAAMDG